MPPDSISSLLDLIFRLPLSQSSTSSPSSPESEGTPAGRICNFTMGFASVVVDSVILFFSAVLILAAPLIDSQVIFPAGFFPPALVKLKQWYIEEFGDYLAKEKPLFWVGLVWLEIFLILPLSIANVYGILARRPWAATTSLITGVSLLTSMAALMGDLLGSGRASQKLLQLYSPFVALSVLQILKGLFSGPSHTATKASHAPSAKKKRA